MRVLGRGTGLSITVLFMAGATAGIAICPPPAASSGSSASSFIGDVNSARASHGLAPLRVDGTLTGVASGHTSDMARQNRLYHNPRLTSEVHGWQVLGENVGSGPDEH